MELTYVITNQNLEDPTEGLCRVELSLCNQKYENSGLQLSNVDEAKYELATLSHLNYCPYVAKGTYVINHNGKVIVLVEPLVRLNTWITQMKDFLKFWNYDPAISKCIGIGTPLKNIFFQVAKALESIHKAHRYHCNITNGVMIGKEEKVRICFFKEMNAISPYAIAQRQLEDLKDFQQLLNNITAMDGPKNGLELPSELHYFLTLFDEISLLRKVTFKNPNQLSAATKWIYNAIFFWKQQRRLFFLDALNECLDYNEWQLEKDNFLYEFHDWQRQLTCPVLNERSFRECLYYNATISGQGTVIYGTAEYRQDFGIIRFIENYKKHYRAFYSVRKTEAEAVEFVTSQFPDFYGKIYREVFRHRNSLICFSGNKKLITFDEVLGKVYSFFDTEDCCE